MSKYDETFKLLVVQSYIQGKNGFRVLAKQYELDPATVRSWVKGHEQHGVKALRKKSGGYSASFKLSVLQQMWREELSARQTLALFDIRGGTQVIRT